ncbi:MAG TPA: TrmH family RNA methyltransferase [Acidimicrobiales bacterium]|nr:TrmH family RNA methyltransferase [Acidimicrobiales bacterium]
MTRQLDSTGLKRLHRTWRRRATGEVGLLLDHVQSPFNVGAILRTAAAFKVDHLWLVGDTASPTNAKTAKTALGSQRYLEWSWYDTVAEAAAAAREDGYRIVGVELTDDAVPLDRVALDGPVALMLGHEDRGLSPAALAVCDAVAFIPQLGRIGSLNVATAAAIALYEVRRRAWADDSEPNIPGGGGAGRGLPSSG